MRQGVPVAAAWRLNDSCQKNARFKRAKDSLI